MKYRVVITEKAKQELKEAVAYISEELQNYGAAAELYNLAEEKFMSLSEFPKRNPEIDFFAIGLSGIRFITINNYLAFYTVDDESAAVKIIRFLYNRRNWQKILFD